MNPKLGCTLGALLALQLPMVAQASDITWSGFLSSGVGSTGSDGSSYVTDPVTGAAYNDDVLFTPDSLIGIQAQSAVTPDLRAIVQVVAKGGNNYNAEVELAFLSYNLTDSVTLNAGRFRLPLYYYSDFLEVGYAYHWARPPMDVYSIPQSGIDGFNLKHKMFIGDTDFELDTVIWYGASDVPFGEEDVLEVRKDWGIAPQLNWNWFKVRLLRNEKVIGGLGGAPIDVTYSAAAFMADYNNFFFQSEASKLDSAFSKTDAYYLSLGYKYGEFTPHVTFSNSNPKEAVDTASIDPVSGIPSQLVDSETESMIVGVRWDFHPSIALKVEHTESTTDLRYTNIITSGASTESSDVSLTSITLEMVF
jgi:hypothetical protein